MSFCLFLGLSAAVAAARPPLPVAFEAHQGPADPQVRFTARTGGTSLALLEDGGAVLSHPGTDGKPHAVRLRLDGALPCPQAVGEGERGEANYFLGNDKSHWRTGIPTWDRVRYSAVWPGVDLVYYAQEGRFEHDFVVAPGADPGAVTLRFEGLGTEAPDVRVDSDGDLQLAGGELTLQAPRIYQEVGGTRQPVAGRYVSAGPGRVRIAVDAYDTEKPLVIDPVIVFSSFLGGSNVDGVEEVAVDSADNTYVAGRTVSDNFPTVNPAFSTHLGYDIFVAKISADGSHLIYSTYLGSSENDQPLGLDVDAAGNAYLSGWVSATDFPVLNALQPTLRGLSDLFVTKLGPTGALAYSTYLGGSSFEIESSWQGGSNIKVKPDGTAYVTGGSSSADFPQVHAVQAGLAPNAGCLFLGLPDFPAPCMDVTLTVISPNGSQILYSTLWGGPDDDVAQSVAIDPSGAAYILGGTSSSGFPLVNPFQSQLKGAGDLFVMKIRPDGTPPVYATLLGGSGDDAPWDLQADAEGNAYILAQTTSSDLPVKNPLQSTYSGNFDWYLAKINPRGTGVDYATYFGGPGFDVPESLGVDVLGDVTMAGYQVSNPSGSTFPTLRPMGSVNRDDGFVVKVHATGPTLLYSTPIGGGVVIGMDVGPRGDAYVGGNTDNSGSIFGGPPNNGPFPLVHPFQPTYGGGSSDGFVMKISDGLATVATPSRIPADPGGTVTVPVRFTPGGLAVSPISFSIDYDRTCLTFDSTDADEDSIPDAITFSVPAAFTKIVMFDSGGNIGILISDLTLPFALLPLSEVARITFHVKPTCGATAVSTLAPIRFSSSPIVISFGNTSGQAVPGIALDGSVQVWGGPHGDCNGDIAVNAADLTATVLELFDGDGAVKYDTPLGGFNGSPTGCDANGDAAINAGDLSCTVLIMFQGQGACGQGATAALQAPTLSVSWSPAASPNGSVQVPVQLQRGSASINTVAFSLVIPNGLTFDPTDANGDGIPDAVSFRLPAGFVGSAQWNPANRAGQLAMAVMDTSGRKPLPASSTIAVITLREKAVKGEDTNLHFGTAPAASFGNTQGSSTPGLVSDGGIAKSQIH